MCILTKLSRWAAVRPIRAFVRARPNSASSHETEQVVLPSSALGLAAEPKLRLRALQGMWSSRRIRAALLTQLQRRRPRR